jgi:hypothetical protein
LLSDEVSSLSPLWLVYLDVLASFDLKQQQEARLATTAEIETSDEMAANRAFA